jgi:hypothetical protein
MMTVVLVPGAWMGGWGWPLPPFEVLGAFSSLAGIDEQHLRWFAAKATPHPIGTMRQPVRISDATWNTVGRAYIACTAERTSEPARATRARTSPDWQYRALDTGHWPMFSLPSETANVLIELAGAVPG